MPRPLTTCLLAFALCAGAAEAQETGSDEERARVLFENGSVLYEEGAYEAAIVAFEKAYELSGKLELQFNIANCYERLGRWTEARDALNLYRAVAPTEERDRLLRRLESLEERIRAAERTPEPAPEPTPTPTSPAATPPVEPTVSTVPTRRRPMWPVLGAGLGAVAVGGGMAVGGWAASRSALDAGDQDAWATDRAINNVGLALGGAGIVLTVVGAVIPVHTGLSIQASPGGLSIHLRR